MRPITKALALKNIHNKILTPERVGHIACTLLC